MLSQIAAALAGEIKDTKSQIEEIAAWLGIEPIDAGLLVASIGGLLAFIF